MAGTLLESKLHRPRARTADVPRARLIERLGRAADARLVLVSAPAGFGKTTLVTQWLAHGTRPVAWLSLDSRDNEPASYWRYVLAALRGAHADVGADALALLDQPSPAVDAALEALVNELHGLPEPTVLVLDDYHLVESREIHEQMAFLVDHLPAGLQLVLGCRADPLLPLARLRARGELAEVRAADLRFTAAEAATYLTGTMGLPLTEQEVVALEDRTEGWIAALQLAALSMRDRADTARFIADFAGDDRYVVDFLVEEVLARQAPEVRSFLLRTSILRTLGGGLCDAVLDREGSAETLRHLDRANLFLVALDDRRQQYRYHHLFGDVLHARLLEEEPGVVPGLHRRAAAWHERSGDRREAIRHSLAAADTDSAARLLELELSGLQRDRQEATLRAWIDALPDDAVRARPVLTVAHVGSRMLHGELDGVEERLQDAERWLAAHADRADGSLPPGMLVSSEERLRALPAAIAVYRAAQARLRGDVPGTITHARRALDVMAPGDSLERGAATALLGLAHWTDGDLATALACYADAMGVFERTGYVSDVAGLAIATTDMLLAQGRLRDARDVVGHVLALVDPAGGPVLRGAGDMHVVAAQLLREQGDLDGALAHLGRSRELGDRLALAQNPYRWRVAMAQLRVAEGDTASALTLLDEAERLFDPDFSPDVRPVAATRARVLLTAGDLDGALAWARRRGLSADDEPSYLREHEHLTFARVLLAQPRVDPGAHHLADALGLVGRVLESARAGGRTGTVVEALVLVAAVHRAAGDRAAARVALEEALRLGGPEGYVRVFADDTPATSTTPAAPAPLPERLSDRELEVLRLLAGDLDGPGIARHLVVSVHTVRTHTKSIYAKLGVNSRRAAVRRATELSLLR